MKILFAHGLASSVANKIADRLRMTLKAEVVAPDLPIEPAEALELLRQLCETERPDLVVGLSWGGFLVHRLQGVRRALINPDLHVSRLMRTKIGSVTYLSPRKDGARSFDITPQLCDRYEALEGFVEPDPGTLLGFFAERDELVHGSSEFAALYPGRTKEYPGKHLPTFPEVKKFIAPALFAYMECNP